LLVAGRHFKKSLRLVSFTGLRVFINCSGPFRHINASLYIYKMKSVIISFVLSSPLPWLLKILRRCNKPPCPTRQAKSCHSTPMTCISLRRILHGGANKPSTTLQTRSAISLRHSRSSPAINFLARRRLGSKDGGPVCLLRT